MYLSTYPNPPDFSPGHHPGHDGSENWVQCIWDAAAGDLRTRRPRDQCSAMSLYHGKRRGLGDLSFDGTGFLGSGLFGYTPWYDTSQWTMPEWAAVAFAGYYALQLFAGTKKRVRRAFA